VPELPEVEALAGFLRQHAAGRVVARVDVGAISVLKTYDPPPTALHGLTLTEVRRHGKFLDLDVDGLHLVTHLARAGWLRWSDALPATRIRPGKSPIALRVRLLDPESGDEPGFDLTEAGTQKRLAVYVVRSVTDVPGIASLGPDPLDPDFDQARLAGILDGSRQQLKGLLRDQSILAGVGNAYSDEVLHAALLSPFAIAGRLDETEVTRLFARCARCSPRPWTAPAANRPRNSRMPSGSGCGCMGGPVRPAPSAVTPCVR
jgi:formamidopyrimidine-DNA glycosylase